MGSICCQNSHELKFVGSLISGIFARGFAAWEQNCWRFRISWLRTRACLWGLLLGFIICFLIRKNWRNNCTPEVAAFCYVNYQWLFLKRVYRRFHIYGAAVRVSGCVEISEIPNWSYFCMWLYIGVLCQWVALNWPCSRHRFVIYFAVSFS
jgi:hypothetical protein